MAGIPSNYAFKMNIVTNSDYLEFIHEQDIHIDYVICLPSGNRNVKLIFAIDSPMKVNQVISLFTPTGRIYKKLDIFIAKNTKIFFKLTGGNSLASIFATTGPNHPIDASTNLYEFFKQETLEKMYEDKYEDFVEKL